MLITSFRVAYEGNDCGEHSPPFSLCSVLIDKDAMRHPYWEDNQQEVARLLEKGFSAIAEFDVDEATVRSEFCRLILTRVDTICKVYLNGIMLDRLDNYHRRYDFNVKGLLESGKNTLVMRFEPALEHIERLRREHFLSGTYDHSVYTPTGKCLHMGDVANYLHLVRKPLYMTGWDWNGVFDDMGVYDTPELLCFDTAHIDDVFVHQTHSDHEVLLRVETEVSCRQGIDGLQLQYVLTAPDGEQMASEDGTFVVTQPVLWWPNGYGAQNLYAVEVALYRGSELICSKSKNIGIRTIRFESQELADRKNVFFQVNGVKIFTMGANYVPTESLLCYQTEEKQRELIRLAKESNYNSIRIWGGGEYGSDALYDECDKQGIIVWQDFMFACFMTWLPDSIRFTQNEEFICQIKRIRGHASLGLFCGNNECAAMAYDWLTNGTQKYGEKYATDYLQLYSEIIPSYLKQLAPDVTYWEASPSVGDRFERAETLLPPNVNENYGDRHCWQVGLCGASYEYYQQHKFPFLSEYGFNTPPSIYTIRKFTKPDERFFWSNALLGRTKSQAIIPSLEQIKRSGEFGEITSLESGIYAMQLFQARSTVCAIEWMRRNRGDCMGSYVWQLNDSWPVISCSVMDYTGRKKPAYYAVRKAYSPIAIFAHVQGQSIALELCNETLKDFHGRIEYALSDGQFRNVMREEEGAACAALSSENVLHMNLPHAYEELFLHYRLLDGLKMVYEGVFIPVGEKKYHFEMPCVCTNLIHRQGRTFLSVQSDVLTREVFLESEIDGVEFSDNLFDIVDEVGIEVEVVGAVVSDDALLSSITVNTFNAISPIDQREREAV